MENNNLKLQAQLDALDKELEEKLTKLLKSNFKMIINIGVAIVALSLYFIFNIRYLGAIIIVVWAGIGYMSAKKEKEAAESLIQEYDRKKTELINNGSTN